VATLLRHVRPAGEPAQPDTDDQITAADGSRVEALR
jgi:hypothetical protein